MLSLARWNSGVWNLVKTDSGQYIIEHTQFPGKPLTAIISAGSAELQGASPDARQLWNTTCTTCPSNGFATNCTFENPDTSPHPPDRCLHFQ
ncbi:hypothetical protein MVEN_00447300 [Mycena venus]|uniref:Uncharacterized protein n=1 Tax=Mycena venus TaxID=2733690 RepID=A0A8H6YXN7_9AGAR|nr:hypothetical protein MVEN_00447300 [Mycena venus]